MFEVEDGTIESALEIFDEWLLPASAQSPLEACDAAGLLWRLALEGVVAEERWRKLSDLFDSATAGFWPFVDLHAALAHLSAGERARAQRLAQAIERCTESGDYAALRARLVTQPGLKALDAWSEGRYAEAAELFAGMRSFLGDAGGSRIQLAVFESIEQSSVIPPRSAAGLVQ